MTFCGRHWPGIVAVESSPVLLFSEIFLRQSFYHGWKKFRLLAMPTFQIQWVFKNFGHFGRKSNGKVRFGLITSDRNIQDHLRRWSTYFGRNVPTEIIRHFIWQTGSLPTSLNFSVILLIRKRNNGYSHSSWFARLDWKMSFHFSQVFALVSYRDVGWSRTLAKRLTPAKGLGLGTRQRRLWDCGMMDLLS